MQPAMPSAGYCMLLILALNSVVPPGIRAEFQHEYPEFQRPTANCSSGLKPVASGYVAEGPATTVPARPQECRHLPDLRQGLS